MGLDLSLKSMLEKTHKSTVGLRLAGGFLVFVLALFAPLRVAMAEDAELLLEISTYQDGGLLGAHCPARIEGSGSLRALRVAWTRDQSGNVEAGKGLRVFVAGAGGGRVLDAVGNGAIFSGDFGGRKLRVLDPKNRELCSRTLPRERGVLFVGRIGGTEGSLVPRVEGAIADAIVHARATGVRGPYRNTVTYNQAGPERREVLEALSVLEGYSTDDLREKVIASRAPAQHQEYQDYVRITLLRGGSGLTARLELIALEGWELLAWKSIGGCGESDDVVIGSLGDVVRQIVVGQPDRTPVAAARLASPVPVWAGSTVELDACDTRDPDFDMLDFTWTGPGLQRTQGRVVDVRVGAPGRYRYRLGVKQLIGPSVSAPTLEATAEVDVFPRIFAHAGPDCYVEPGAEVVLGQCVTARNATVPVVPAGVSRSWRLLSGPLDNAAAERVAARGRYQPRASGTYTWELSVSHAAGVETDQVIHLVAQKPKATLLTGRQMSPFVGERVELGLSLEPDPLDRHPSVRWTLWRLEGEPPADPCGGDGLREPSVRSLTEGAVLAQRNERAAFTSVRTGRFLAVVCAKFRRRFGDVERVESVGDAVVIDVGRPGFFLGVQAGAGAVATAGSKELKGYVVPYAFALKLDVWSKNRLGVGTHVSYAASGDVAAVEPDGPTRNGWFSLGPNFHAVLGRHWDWHFYLGFSTSPFTGPFAGAHPAGFEIGHDLSLRLMKTLGLLASVRARGLLVDSRVPAIGGRLVGTELGLGAVLMLPAL